MFLFVLIIALFVVTFLDLSMNFLLEGSLGFFNCVASIYSTTVRFVLDRNNKNCTTTFSVRTLFIL